MRRQTKQCVAAVVAALLGSSPLHAAVVTGPDGKPVRVKPGESAPPGSTPPPTATPRAPGAFPGLPNGPLGKRRLTPPAPGATPGATPTGTPPATTGTGTTPPSGSGTTGVTGANQLIGDKDFNTCKKFPAGKRIVKVNLKPDTELGDLIAWISSITCKSFVLPGHLSAGGKKLTFVTQGTMTPNEAYAMFLTALDSVGLAVERGPGYYKIIETSKAKTGNVPVYGFDGKQTQTPPKRPKSSVAGD